MIGLISYLSGAFSTALMWLWMLKRVTPEWGDFKACIKDGKYTLLFLSLLWFIILPIVGIYWLIKLIGRSIHRSSNGRLARGAM